MFAGSTIGYPRAVAALGASTTAKAVALVPAGAALLAWFWLGEVLGPIAIGGVALVVAGTLASALKFWKRTPTVQG